MSIRAYRINEIKHEQTDTFNLWHDEGIVDFLSGCGCFDGLDECGVMDIPVYVLTEMLNVVGMTDDQRQQIQTDIDYAIKNGNESVQYYCY